MTKVSQSSGWTSIVKSAENRANIRNGLDGKPLYGALYGIYTVTSKLSAQASRFGFRARHSTTLQCIRLTDHVILISKNNMSAAAVFFDIETAFDTTWHLGFLYKLSILTFSISLI
jgi:hypothetical protein